MFVCCFLVSVDVITSAEEFDVSDVESQKKVCIVTY